VPVATLEQNLDGILERVAAAQPGALLVLAGMQSPPNMGGDYTQAFRAVFPRVAERHAAALVPFLLEGVGGVAELNQGDGIHPTAAGQRVLADNVWDVLAPLLAPRLAPNEAEASVPPGSAPQTTGDPDVAPSDQR
jgi:acyl-CoA thioesterase-1